MKNKLIFLPIALFGASAAVFSSSIFESEKANIIEVDDAIYIQKYIDKDVPDSTKVDKDLIFNQYLQNMLDRKPWEKDYVDDDKIVDVVVMLNAEYIPFIKLNSVEETINASVSIIKDEKGKINYTIDGKSATLKEIEDIYKKIDKNILKNSEYKIQLLQQVLSWENPNTQNEKPELSAPGTQITDPKQNNLTASGTSFASPHATAIAAQLMSKQNWFIDKTMATKAVMLANAIDEVEGTDDSPNSNDMKAGEGGVRFAKYNQAWEMFDGSCSSFERTTYISQYSNKTRIVLTWLNRGDYMISHQSKAYGNIGLDLDMRVYDPDGDYVGGAYSWDNPYEIVEFDPVKSGTYTIKVNCYKKRDTGFDRKMGMASVSFY